MTAVTTRKTSLQNKHLTSYDYFAIIPSCSHSAILTKDAATGLFCSPQN